MLGLVCLRTFPSRNVAEVARAALESHGIAATVSASDAGYDISFASGGAKLLVNEDSADSAEEVLASIQVISNITQIQSQMNGVHMLLLLKMIILTIVLVLQWVSISTLTSAILKHM